MAALEALARDKARAFRATFVGQSLPAVTLNASPTEAALGHGSALTDNFLPVTLCHPAPANQLGTVTVDALNRDNTLNGYFIPAQTA